MATSGSIRNSYRATGTVVFTANGANDTVDFVHGLNIVGTPVFVHTALLPITISHLGRDISYPDTNTIRLTFAVPPVIGEDQEYRFIVF